MFKKIVSHLAFSPSLIQELGFYAKRLHKEEITRKTGLILTALALIVQSFAVFQPPESANAANASDLVYGGIHTKSQLLAAWDNNSQNYRDMLQHAGITRENLASARDSEISTRSSGRDNGWQSWSRVSRFGLQRGEVQFQVGSLTLYSRPMAEFDTGRNRSGSGSWYKSFVGTTSEGKPFAIMKACANIMLKELPKQKPKPTAVCKLLERPVVTDRTKVSMTAYGDVQNGATIAGYTFIIKNSAGTEVLRKRVNTTATSSSLQHTLDKDGTYTVSVIVHTSLGDQTNSACASIFTISPKPRCPLNPSLPIDHPDCQPCPGDATIWVKDTTCKAQVTRTKAAHNLTSGGDATKKKANASDRIEYKLTAKNEGKAPATVDLKDELSDVLEYADIYDNGGGTFDKEKRTLSWPRVTLKPGEQKVMTYVVQLKGQLSAKPRGTSDPSSYDCRMTNVFGTSVEIVVNCPTPKVVEQTVATLPRTGPGENMLFAGIIAAVVTFFYCRSRQLSKEVRIIRRDITAGTL